MPRFFNTAGPCVPLDHYMLPPRKQYFVVHAPRQTGKTTAMRAYAAHLREHGIAACWVTLEESRAVDDFERAEPIWLGSLEVASHDQLLPPWRAAAIRPTRTLTVRSRRRT